MTTILTVKAIAKRSKDTLLQDAAGLHLPAFV